MIGWLKKRKLGPGLLIFLQVMQELLRHGQLYNPFLRQPMNAGHEWKSSQWAEHWKYTWPCILFGKVK